MTRSRRTRKTKNTAVTITTTKQLKPFVPSNMVVQKVSRPRPLPRKRGRVSKIQRNRRMIPISNSGIAFLKCAFAAPDFGVDPGMGIVDKFQGRTINIKDSNTTAMSFEAEKDTFILSLPVPGYQYFIGTAAIGSVPTTFQGVPYPTYATNFGNGTTVANNYTRFRYAAGAAGLYPTSNMQQFSGSIQVWRVDVNMSESLHTTLASFNALGCRVGSVVGAAQGQGTFTTATTSNPTDVQFTATSGEYGINQIGLIVDDVNPTNLLADKDDVVKGTVSKTITGLRSITSASPRDSYNDSFIKGCFGVMLDRTDDFEWSDFVSGDDYTDGTMTLLSESGKPLKGLGNLNGLVIKVSTPTGAVNAALLRTWTCMEMQPNTDSSLYQFSKISPPHDSMALELYHKYAERLPVAVPCAQNGFSWQAFMQFAEKAFSVVGRYAPVVGGVASAISDVIGGINAWAF